MTKEEVLELIRESLSISIDIYHDYGCSGLVVYLHLDGEVISRDTVHIQMLD